MSRPEIFPCSGDSAQSASGRGELRSEGKAVSESPRAAGRIADGSCAGEAFPGYGSGRRAVRRRFSGRGLDFPGREKGGVEGVRLPTGPDFREDFQQVVSWGREIPGSQWSDISAYDALRLRFSARKKQREKQEDERREDAEWRRMTLRGIMRELRLAGGGRLSSFGR